jgi:predicted O-methyltransferase YrrM
MEGNRVKLPSSVRNMLFFARRLNYLRRSGATDEVFANLLKSSIRNGRDQKLYCQAQQSFKAASASLKVSSDWTSGIIPFWFSIFDEFRLQSKANLKVLEIGAWEGLTSYFILSTLPRATLTCVDSWEISDPTTRDKQVTAVVQAVTESHFDSNLSMFHGRLEKYKGTSFSFFLDHSQKSVYELIYIDGSHYADDVLIDALRCFELLKVGGILIFDDYFYMGHRQFAANPAAAINAFLRLKAGSYRIVRIYSQLVIEKTADTSRSLWPEYQ